MTFETIKYMGYEIKKRNDIKSHCASVYYDGKLVELIAGSIEKDGSTNAIEKAKSWIAKTTHQKS